MYFPCLDQHISGHPDHQWLQILRRLPLQLWRYGLVWRCCHWVHCWWNAVLQTSAQWKVRKRSGLSQLSKVYCLEHPCLPVSTPPGRNSHNRCIWYVGLVCWVMTALHWQGQSVEFWSWKTAVLGPKFSQKTSPLGSILLENVHGPTLRVLVRLNYRSIFAYRAKTAIVDRFSSIAKGGFLPDSPRSMHVRAVCLMRQAYCFWMPYTSC